MLDVHIKPVQNGYLVRVTHYPPDDEARAGRVAFTPPRAEISEWVEIDRTSVVDRVLHVMEAFNIFPPTDAAFRREQRLVPRGMPEPPSNYGNRDSRTPTGPQTAREVGV